MAESAKATHHPYDPCGGTDPPAYDPASGHYAAGASVAVDQTRVNLTADATGLRPL